jgi:hypothetical protein
MALPPEGLAFPSLYLRNPCEGFVIPQEGFVIPSEGFSIPWEGLALPLEGLGYPREGLAFPSGGFSVPWEGMGYPPLPRGLVPLASVRGVRTVPNPGSTPVRRFYPRPCGQEELV